MTMRNTARRSLNRMYGISEEETMSASSTSHKDVVLHRGSSCNSLELSTSLSVASNVSNQTDRSSLEGSIGRPNTAPLRQTSSFPEDPHHSRLSLDSKMVSRHEQLTSSAALSAKPIHHGESLRPDNVQHLHENERYAASSSTRAYLCSSEDLQAESDEESEEDTNKVRVPPTLRSTSPHTFVQQPYVHKCPTCGCFNGCGLQTQQYDVQTHDVSSDAPNSSTQISRWWYFGMTTNEDGPRFDDSRAQLWYFGPRPVCRTPDRSLERRCRHSNESSRRRSKRANDVVQDFV